MQPYFCQLERTDKNSPQFVVAFYRLLIEYLNKNSMQTSIKNYELMLIYTPVLTEEEYKNAQTKLSAYIKENGGTLVNENPWGLRSLAYPIEKKTTAFYHVIEYTAPSDLNAKLIIEMNRDEQILRHLITQLDKHAVQYNAKKKNGGSAKSEN